MCHICSLFLLLVTDVMLQRTDDAISERLRRCIYAQRMSTPVSIRRKYLSNFLAIAIAISGLQAIAISSTPVASAAAPALSWTTSTLAGNGYGPSLATSADGSKVFVGATNRAFLSTDYGVSWTTITALSDLNGSNYQTSVAMSADGTKIYYAFKNQIYYSWNTGQTWTNKTFGSANVGLWSMDVSDDGTKILITNRDNNEYDYSTNSGQTWTQVSDTVGKGGWAGAISGDGTKIIIATQYGTPRIGTLGGTLTPINLGAVNWGTKDFRGAACDATCTNIVISSSGNGVFSSSDSGATWRLGTNSADSGFKNLQFDGPDINSDGSRMAVTVSWDVRRDVYISTDYGLTWTTQNVSNSPYWSDVAIASTGNYIYAMGSNNPITFGRATFPTPSTTTLTTPGATGVYGTSDTLTATISSNTATGTVDFKNNGTSITGCSAKTVTAGVATCNPSVGTYSNVTAVYGGSGSLSGSTSNSVSFTVTPAPLTVTASSPTVNYGATKPSITASYSGLLKGDTSSAVTGLSCDTVYTTTSPAGSLPATSCSGGTASNYTIAYLSGAVIINKIAPTLSLALPGNALTATFGALVVITATVSKPGSVTFNAGGSAILGCISVAATTTGICNWTPSAANSTTVLTADFIPTDSTSYTSLTASGSKTINVGKATQSVTNTATLTSFNLGQSDTLTATVSAGASGTVTFSAGGNSLCTTGSLDSAGMASCAWTPTTAGTYSVTSSYSGDSNYVTATSSSSSIVVNSVITYDLNGGIGTAPTAFTSPGSSTTLPNGSGLSKSGYTFGGWSTTSGGTAVSSTYSSSTSRTLYAVWIANQYTITFDANGGSGSQTASSYITAATATALPATTTFTRTGYTFGGWAVSATSSTPVTSYSSSATVTFYAIWIHGTYKVRFLANGGTGTMETQTSSATANLTANTFTFTDRTFIGWNTSADGTGTTYSNSQSYPFLADLTLYARWGNLISFSSQGAASGSPSFSSQSWTSGAMNLATVGTMVKAGYTFSGWTNGTQTYAGGASYTPTAGITFNPVWTAITYTISYNSNQATSGTVPANQSWTTGTTARTLAGNPGALVKSGYTFGGWATSASSTTRVTTYSTTANQVFYTIWNPVNYTITYALNGGTSTLPTQANQRIGNSFTLAATPSRANYNFAGWSDSTTAYGALATYTITASTPSAITLTAQWIPVYTVSYILNGSTDSVTAPTLYDSGTVISLAVAPTLTGHTFAGWVDSGNNLRAASSSFTVVQNSTLQARWTAISYSVTYNLGGASGTLPLQSSLTINQTFPVAPAPTRAGYIFNGWNNGSETYTAGSTYIIATSNVTLTAQWSAIPYTVTFDLGGGVGTLPTQGDGFIGTTFSLPSSSSNPTWIAHTFTGWSDGSALYAAGSTYTFSAADVTLTAQFSLNGYTQINYSLGSYGVGALPTQSSKLEGNTIIVARGDGITRANYAFAGWSDGSATYQPGDVYLVGPESSPITFVPSWTSGYNVSYSTGSGFGVAPVDPVGRITGATFTVASASTVFRQGFTFTGWSDGTRVVAAGSTYTVASSNITLTAQWVQNSLAGIPSNALTPLASFSIVNGVGPNGGFNFGSSSVSYEIPVNALSAGTVISIYGLTDFSSLAGIVPSGKTVISSTVISWLGTDGTVQDTSSPIKMTITDSQIVPGSVVYAVTGGELTLLGTASTNGSITTTIVSDPVILIANPVSAPAPAPAPAVVVVDNSAALAAAKELADKKAAEEAALKAAQEKMAADAKALADAKAAADAAAIKAAQDAADASAKAAAELQAAKDAALAQARAAQVNKPAITLYTLSSTLKLSAYDSAYLAKYVKSLKNGATVTCIGYAYGKTPITKSAQALAKRQATAVCSLMKKTNKTLKTSIVVYPASKAPKAATGAKWVGVSYRIDGFRNER
ncbi:MAG: hypothetical protein RL589_601 [Actinomycetota bacterium]|jgi:uncharacterized repeat protein (TIGR02543 family)